MFFKNKIKDVVIYLCLFLIFYGAVMLIKYMTNDVMNWLYTFIFMFSISIILLLLKQIGNKKGR